MKLGLNNTKKKPGRYYVGGGLTIGAAVGLLLLGGVPGLPFGAAIGLLIGASMDRWASKNVIREFVVRDE